MRILGAIVEPAADLLAIGVADLSHRRRVSAKPVGHDLPRSAVFLHDALEKLHRRRLVSLRLLSRRWERARKGEGQLALVDGEPGTRRGFRNPCGPQPGAS